MAVVLSVCAFLASGVCIEALSEASPFSERRWRLSFEFICVALKLTAPVWLYFLAIYALAAVARLIDPRPYLVLDDEGIRFRWAGSIPWSQVGAVRKSTKSQTLTPSWFSSRFGWWLTLGRPDEIEGANSVRVLCLDLKFGVSRSLRQSGSLCQRLYFWLQSLPLGWTLLGLQFGRIHLVGTSVDAELLKQWIDARLDQAKRETAGS